MSVFGGDSWAREAHHRKRRVDDLLIDGVDCSSFKRLSNGKFTCLVCSNRPLLDSSLMLSMHSKGARHRAELSRLKAKELMKRDDINKRIALSVSQGSPSSSTTVSVCGSRPLIEQTRKELSSARYVPRSSEIDKADAKESAHHYSAQAEDSSLPDPRAELVDFRERRERELNFTAAGWKRDGHGSWYRDENVEFDSDDEDPNIVLA